ncbi:UDP-2,3-diacylglucosamine diphosphatase [Trinickia caryophylli]|uniref:UDP-2,3-diacylglucosamine diphosphatase n=1 Tax=Trinickia caryophylli TaxID=28094 RepID=UPI000C88ABE1|nr:UDP-2,3-diacylglucosamine diphosphatase [Trinickia caryophylli]PMS12410.1 UDP-2,3-diacylglucosamine diphosphatase [Trinickia caryophylli]TRX16959.1 UDP-2,3-diacylglucosamine diphosphatase [Trinickia caryophylli]WQE12306.1 UDP-2,3-diacylglucosamine diphosphatase [Trinickia caryophylli]GLU31548.1 UDP-2,3-diacylglucosamine hydrolase [Trinickia caryophylli]
MPYEHGHTRAHAPRPLLFISDLHLSPAIPRTVDAFEHFILVTADSADSVFVLGDLFEYWIGDDTLGVDPFAARIAALLHTLTERGIALYLMHGNRDFLLGKRFMRAAGAIWLPDPFVMTAFGSRIVLAHGDALCTADHKYQTFRRFARCRPFQWLFLAWPLRWRQALAERMRSSSEEGRSRPPSPLYDVTNEGVSRLFKTSRTATMIHGHTHKPARHQEKDGTRWVLPDWDLDHGTRRGGYLRIDAEGIHALPLD